MRKNARIKQTVNHHLPRYFSFDNLLLRFMGAMGLQRSADPEMPTNTASMVQSQYCTSIGD